MHLVIIFNKEMHGFGRTGGKCSHEASLSGEESGGGGLHMGIRMGGSAGDPLGILGGSNTEMGDPLQKTQFVDSFVGDPPETIYFFIILNKHIFGAEAGGGRGPS